MTKLLVSYNPLKGSEIQKEKETPVPALRMTTVGT